MPTIRYRGSEREPAPEDEHFPVLQYLTEGGRKEWTNATARIKRALIVELDRRAAPALDRGGRPELTSEDIMAAVAALEQKMHAAAEPVRPPRAGLWAAITLTIASIGISVMPGFLGETWSYVVFAAFIVTGVVGLVLTWVAGTVGPRHGRSQPPPDLDEYNA
jgi:hypothetical protein